jgi:hypothetical protein
MTDKPKFPNTTTANNAIPQNIPTLEEMVDIIDHFKEKYAHMPEAMLSSESLWKKLEEWIKAQYKSKKPANDFGIVSQIYGIMVIVIPDYDALKIPELGLHHVLLGKRKAIYELLDKYGVVPNGGEE